MRNSEVPIYIRIINFQRVIYRKSTKTSKKQIDIIITGKRFLYEAIEV